MKDLKRCQYQETCRMYALDSSNEDSKPCRIATVSTDAPFQRELRIRQCRWREKMGYPIGSHNGKPLGSRLAMPEAELKLWNFLTPTIGKLVWTEYGENTYRSRIEKKMYGYPRLYEDLLSSQPMAFNLFGELAANLSLATHAARQLWPDRVAKITRIEFEWSPGRWNHRYLNNGTAADVALFHTTPTGGHGAIFVETKYHENLQGNDYDIKPRYLDVCASSEAFQTDKLESLMHGSLQQIWFDHLLLLATADTDRLDTALFTLLFPEINTPCASAVLHYEECLTPSGSLTFEARTIEDFIGSLQNSIGSRWIEDFKTRYL